MNLLLISLVIISSPTAAHGAEHIVGSGQFKTQIAKDDILSVTKACNPKEIPINDPNVKIEKVGKEGKHMFGTPMQRYKVALPNGDFYMMTIAGKDKTVEDFKSGNYRAYSDSCNFIKQYKIVGVDDTCTQAAPKASEEAGATK